MTTRAHAWARIPQELKARRQWCVAGASKAPLSMGPDGKLFNAAVTNPSDWMDFETAARIAWEKRELVTTHVKERAGKPPLTVTQTGFDIGYVLCESDPYTCIDLDVKDPQNAPDDPEKWTTPEQFDLYYRILKTFQSYAESSRSGKGLHIWIRGDVGKGMNRDGIELYSRERFIICTGNVVQDAPIEDRQALLTNMASQMRSKDEGKYQLSEVDADEDDWSVLVRAVSASNADKFCRLWRGEWEGSYKSQSEADLALLSMFTFYSPSNAQVRRLFRESALGKREKAQKDDKYIDSTLRTIRAREAAERATQAAAVAQALQTQEDAKRQLAMQAVQQIQSTTLYPAGVQARVVAPLHVPGQGTGDQRPQPTAAAATLAGPVSEGVVKAGEKGLAWPPGLAGRIAQFIYQNAPRPVKEVSIVGALGLLAGLCGKAWHIPQSGLNMYIILVARSAVGKEAMHSGISAILRSCSIGFPQFANFVDFTDFASGPALIKACAANPCFVNVSGEWGRKLKRLANDERADGPLQTLRTQMTNLYQKSGPQSVVGGIGYSNKDNNIASISGVSYSMIGETTPGTFYEALTESMMEDGFLSRFLIIEYDGDRPVMNNSQVMVPDQSLQDSLIAIAQAAYGRINNPQSSSLMVGRDEQSAYYMKTFEDECDTNINSTEDESQRQMWNRAALKALRIAALLAVADNWHSPCITMNHYSWAMDVVRRDIAIMGKRLDTGDVGQGDNARERKLVAVLRDYIAQPVPASYKIPDGMQQNSLVPRSYLQLRTQRTAAFYNHRNGQNSALEGAIQSLLANGYIMEVQKDKVAEAYNYHGKTYRILKLPDYAAQSKKA